MEKLFVDILARFEPGINPEEQFKQSRQQRSALRSSASLSQESGEEQERSPKVTIRSLRSGKPVPCDCCGEIWILDDYCVGCGIGRGGLRRGKPGLEPIGSILARLLFDQEEGEA